MKKSRMIVGFLVLLVLGGAATLVARRVRKHDEILLVKGNMYMQSNNTSQAIEYYRRVLAKKKTRHHEAAQMGIIRAYILRHEFDKALAEIDAAAADWLAPGDAVVRRASVKVAQAQYEMQAIFQTELTAEKVEGLLVDYVLPAINFVKRTTYDADEPALMLTHLAELYEIEARALSCKHGLALSERDMARNLENQEEANEWQAQAEATFPAINAALARAAEAYRKALDADPESQVARIKYAQYALRTPGYGSDAVRELLAPVIEATPDQPDARRMLAELELREGDFDKALAEISSIESKDQADLAVQLAKLKILASTEQWREAMPIAHELLALAPADSQVGYWAPYVLLHEDRPDLRAAAVAEAADRLQNLVSDRSSRLQRLQIQFPEDRVQLARARYWLGKALLARGKREQGLQVHRQLQAQTEPELVAEIQGPALVEEMLKLRRDSFRDVAEALSDAPADDPTQKADPGEIRRYEVEGELLRGRLHSVKAEQRLRTLMGRGTPEEYETILEEDIRPGIEIIQKYADSSEAPEVAYTALGDTYVQERTALLYKVAALRVQAEQLLKDPQKKAEADARMAEATAAAADAQSAVNSALRAYKQAMSLDPDLLAPRLVAARLYLEGVRPRPDLAKELLEEIIQENPEDRAARDLLASAAQMAGDYDAALEHLKHIQYVGSNKYMSLLREVDILVAAERWEQAAARSKELVEMEQDNPLVGYLRAVVLLHEDDPDKRPAAVKEAIAHLRRVCPEERAWADARFALGHALLEDGEREEALSTLKRALREARPRTITERQRFLASSYRACLTLARELMQEDPKTSAAYAVQALAIFPARQEAFQVAREALKVAGAPDNDVESLYLLRSSGSLAGGDLEGGLAVCRQALAEAKDDSAMVRVRLLMARLLQKRGDYQEAAAEFQKLQGVFPDNRPAYELAALRARLNQTAEARKVYEQLVASNPADARALAGLVGMLLREGDLEGARAAVKRAEGALGPEAARALLLNVSLKGGRTDEAIELMRAQVEAEPDSPVAHTVLAELLWSSGDLSGARAEFDKARGLAPDYGPAYRRGLLDLQVGNADEAVALYTQAVDRLPGLSAAREALALAYQAAGDVEKAISTLEEGRKDGGLPTMTRELLSWYLAVVQAGQGRGRTATRLNEAIRFSYIGLRGDRQRLLQRLSSLPEEGRPQAALALNLLVAFARAGQEQATEKQLERMTEMLPDEPAPRCLYVSLLQGRGENDRAAEECRAVIRDHPTLGFARTLLANIYVRQGDIDAAVQVLEDALAAVSEEDAVPMHVRLGELYQRQGRTDRAIASYETAMSYEDTAAVACNNLAMIYLTEKSDPAAALPLAEKALEKGGGLPAILDTLGWVHCVLGDHAKAIPLLEAAKRGLPAMPTVRYHLGAAYAKAGRTEDARKELEEALAISATFPEAEEARRLLESL